MRRVHRSFVLGVLALFPLSGADAAPLFPNPVYPTGLGATGIARGDFDGDGNVDLAAGANASPYRFLVLPGRGDGTFGPLQTHNVTAFVIQFVSGDLNGDGRDDLVGRRETSLSVHLGQADGSFVDAPTISRTATNMTLGDVDGDGHLDLAVVSSGTLAVLRGSGDGTFFAPITGATIANPGGVALGDFNGDGRVDLAVGGHGSTLGLHSGLGGGAFGPPVAVPAGSNNGYIHTADVDNDGDLDLLTITFSQSSPFTGVLNTLLNNGNGGFSSPLTRTLRGDGQAGFALADFDRDGVLDVAVLHSHSGQQPGYMDLLELLRGSSGPFLPDRLYGIGSSSARSLVAADFDDDGAPDIATTDWFNAFATLRNEGAGTFGEPLFGPRLNVNITRLVHGDFDEDSIEDVAMLENSLDVLLFIGTGLGGFEPARRFAADYPDGLAAGDFDGDHHLDLAVTGSFSKTLGILRGRGDGMFEPLVSVPAGDVYNDIIAADFDGDGRDDLAAATAGASSVAIYYALPGGVSFYRSRFECGLSPRKLAAADFDADGALDLVVVNWGGTNTGVWLLRGLEGGLFDAPLLLAAIYPPTYVLAEELTGDSFPDIVTTTQTGGVSLFRGGPGGLGSPESLAVPGRTFAAGDFDGDGVADLALFFEWVTVLRGAGGGAFHAAESFATLGYPESELIAADFSGDGVDDLAMRSSDATMTLLISQASPVNRPPAANAGADSTIECTAPQGAAVSLDGSLSSDPDSTPGSNDDIATFEWFEAFGTPGQTLLGTGETLLVTLPLGTHSLTLRTTDQGGLLSADTVDVIVVDTSPPELQVGFDPAVLWPPNHRMVHVDAVVTAIDACGPASFTLLSLSSDELDDAPGGMDGATTNDIEGAAVGTADVAFALRAERSASGAGRTYTAGYRASDVSGNVRDVAATVFVPHNFDGVTEPLILQANQTTEGTVLDWPDVGPGTIYRVLGGDLRFLRTMGQDPSAPIACIASGLTVSNTIGFAHSADPAPGSAVFYLVEYDDGQARGYGTDSTFWDRDAALGAPCP